MSIKLPAAPASFYAPSLSDLKLKLEQQNGASKGRLVLISAPPANIDSAWAEVGVGGNSILSANRGAYVVGHKDIAGISGILQGPEEEGGEVGYKLVFDEVLDIPVYIDGTGSSTAVIVGIALVEGVDTFAAGTDGHVKYIFKVDNVVVNDGALIKLPSTEITIYFSEEDGAALPIGG